MDGIPDCSCGHGKMDLRRAGVSAMNPGRLYYKCPLGGNHPGHFIWCDEHSSHTGSRKYRDQNQSTASSGPVPHSGESRVDAKKDRCCIVCGLNKNHSDFTSLVMLAFMTTVLVLLGFLIGKVM